MGPKTGSSGELLFHVFCILQETYVRNDEDDQDLSFTVISKTSVLLRQNLVLGSNAYDGDDVDDQDRRDLGQEVSSQAQARARMAPDMPKTTQDGARVAPEGAKMAQDRPKTAPRQRQDGPIQA